MNETKQAKFTPEPWEVDEGEANELGAPVKSYVVVASAGKDWICALPPSDDESIDLANAYLIAAAPTLYEALDKLASAVLLHLTLNPSEITNAFNAAQIALAKAAGPAVGHTDAF